jgi:hypothetical protein
MKFGFTTYNLVLQVCIAKEQRTTAYDKTPKQAAPE